jgi:hypothetical protein
MREETKRKLSRALWRERAKKAAIAAVFLPLIGLYFLFEDYDAHVDNIKVPVTVVSVEPLNTNNTKMVEAGLTVGVTLPDGRRVKVMALKTSNPYVGEQVEITEHRHRTGRVTYTWK